MLSFRAMADPTLQNPTPQFGTVEYAGSPGGDHCQFCHQPIGGNYFRTNGAMTCPGCAEKMRGELAKDTHAAYVRAIIFGVGAAIVGMILYATFAIVTGIVIGYAALAVGWLVGKAMIKALPDRRGPSDLCRSLNGGDSRMDPLFRRAQAQSPETGGAIGTRFGLRFRCRHAGRADPTA